MNNLVMRWLTPTSVAILPLAGLVAVLAGRDALGIQADPLRVMVAFLAGMLALGLAAHSPAAFIAPVLFLPRLKEVSALSGLGIAENWTALYVAGALLGAGILLRWLRGSPPDSSLTTWRDSDPPNGVVPAGSRFRHSGRASIAFLLFAALVSASYLYTASPNYGGTKLLGFLTLGCGLFLAPVLLFRSERDFRDFTFGTVLFGMAVATSSLSFSATGAMGSYANPSHIGKGQAIGLAMLLLLFTPFKDRRLRGLALLVCIPWLALGMVSSETRGPLFSLMLVLLLSCFVPTMRSPLIPPRQMAFAAAALVAAVMLLSMYWFYGNEASRFRTKTDEIVMLMQNLSEAHGTGVMRLNYDRAALSVWLEHPVFGWGIGGWSMGFWQRDLQQYPHNLFLETLVEQGLAGLAALTYFLIAVFRQLRASRTQTSDSFPAMLPCLVYLLSIAMFSGDLDDNRFIWFWCGLTLAGCKIWWRAERRPPTSTRDHLPRCVAFDAPTDQPHPGN